MIAGIQFAYLVLAVAGALLVWQLVVLILAGRDKRRRKSDIDPWQR